MNVSCSTELLETLVDRAPRESVVVVVVVVVVVDLDGDGDVEVDATVDATTATHG